MVQDEGKPDTLTDVVQERVQDAKEKLQPAIEEQREKIVTLVTETNSRVDVYKVVTTVALVGILWTSRRHLKFSKKVIKNMDTNMENAQATIKALKEAGQTFEFYPGVGIWVS